MCSHVDDSLQEADILALQEIDVGCDRSGGVDTGLAIAEELKLNYVFFEEFEELRSPLRNEATQGGGFHGNGILTKFEILDASIIKHRCVMYTSQLKNDLVSVNSTT